MKRWMILAIGMCFFATAWAEAPECWQQVSDQSRQVESIVKTWENHGMLFGKVVQAFHVTGAPFIEYCTACHGVFHNKPIVGLTFMWGGVKTAPNHWTHLEILDPRSGKIYKGYLTIRDHGQQLKLRGYIGVPLLGRTQVWYKTTCPA